MLGSSRIEKGFGELEKLLPLFPPRFGKSRVHLAIQVIRDSPDPNVRHVIKWLDSYVNQASEKDPVVELLDGPVPEDIYFSWFARTDILIAPCVSPKYVASTSSVFVEAVHFRVPSVTFRGTWMAAQIEKAAASGLKIGEVADDLAEFPRMANAIWTQLESYQRDLASYLRDWQQFNNASRLVQILKNRQA
jgi:glycosyltransferase involved in cell wall biosynthesis